MFASVRLVDPVADVERPLVSSLCLRMSFLKVRVESPGLGGLIKVQDLHGKS